MRVKLANTKLYSYVPQSCLDVHVDVTRNKTCLDLNKKDNY